MKISACIITKNEEENINKCLNSIKDIVDEIIIVDNESTDNTINIASEYTANIHSIKWENDFSKARNFAIDKAKGDYILFLDADEYFNEIFQLKNYLENEKELKEEYFIKIINIDSDEDNKMIDEFWAVRLFKNDKVIRYQGRIHEQLIKYDGENIKIGYIKDALIYHTGYSRNMLKDKAERNLKLLKEELNLGDNKERLYSYLAETYHYLGNEKEAEYYAGMDISLGKRNVSYASRSYRILIELLKGNSKKLAELKSIIEKAMTYFPKLPEFKAEYALYFAELFDYENAIKNMKEAIKLSDKYNDIEPTIFKQDKIEIANGLIVEWENMQKSELKISACVIVKNEEKNITKWLKNSAIYADEQIVVDTGSEDNTVEIVKSSEAKLYHYKWNDNFADAKNYAISKATGDWIVFLDADEYFSNETIENVRNIIKREHKNFDTVDAILCTIINIDIDQGNKEIHRFINLRIFRNVDYLKFHGNIHEAISNSKRELHILIEKNQLQIIHTGYSKNIVEKKIKRNLELLLDDIEKNGEGIQHYRYLSDCYHALGEHDQAIKYVKLHIRSNATSVGNESDMYRNLINSMVISKYDPKDIEVYLEKALKLFPNMPDFYAYYGANLFRENRYGEAKPYLEKAIELNEMETDYNEATVFANLVSETYSYLAEINIKEGDLKTAMINIDKSLQDNKYNKKTFVQLIGASSGNYNDIIITINKYYNIKEECDFAIESLYDNISDNNSFEIFKLYTDIYRDKYKNLNEKFETTILLYKGRNNEAESFIIKNISEEIKAIIVAYLSIGTEEELRNIKDYLPSNIKVILERFSTGRKLNDVDFDDYMVVLMSILDLKKEFIEQIMEIANDFSDMIKVKLAIKLCEYKLWQYAEKIFLEVLNKVEDENGEIFYRSAICNFYLGNIESSKKCFLEAQRLGSPRNEIDVYLKWLEKE